MWIQVLLLFAANLIVPVYLIYSIWRANEESKYYWLLHLLISGGYIVSIFLYGRWDWTGYYLRYVIVALFMVAAVFSYTKIRHLPFWVGEGRDRWLGEPVRLFELAAVVALLVFTVRGVRPAGEAVKLTSPLRGERFYVAHGGSNTLLNRHHPVGSQQYALDIVQLNPAGFRANGILPKDLDRYAIYGKPVYSPCEGTVFEAVDGLQDNIPPEMDSENLTGNHVVIVCEDVRVLLAHLQEGSVQVSEGDEITPSQPVGAVGNSGNTTEPHLHLHAVDESTDVMEGEGMPVRIEGRFLVRNMLMGGYHQ